MKIKSIGINVRHGRELEEVRPNGMGFYLLSVIKSKAEYIIDGVFCEVTPPSYVIMRPTTSVVFRATKEEAPMKPAIIIDTTLRAVSMPHSAIFEETFPVFITHKPLF